MNGKERLDDDLILEIKKRLREIRRGKDITQETVLKTTGIHIARIENANYVMNINITTLSHICSYYKISLKELFTGMKW